MSQCAGDEALIEIARRNHVLNALPDPCLEEILDRDGLVQLDHARVLFRQDAAIPAVYFPIEGVVSILVGAHEKEQIEVATVGREGVVGVSVAMGVTRAPGRAVVQIPGKAISISVRACQEACGRDPRFIDALNRYLYTFLRVVMQSGACNRLHSPEERCARWLLMAHDRAGADRFPLTQRFIAEMMGTRRANVNVALSQFRRAGAIDYTYGNITVIDREELESFACPCYELLRSVEEEVRP